MTFWVINYHLGWKVGIFLDKIFVVSPTGSLPTLDANKDEDEGHQELEFWAPTSAFSGIPDPWLALGNCLSSEHHQVDESFK